MFSFPPSANKAKRGVEFRHSTRLQKPMGSGDGSVLMGMIFLSARFPGSAYSAMCGIQCKAKKNHFVFQIFLTSCIVDFTKHLLKSLLYKYLNEKLN